MPVKNALLKRGTSQLLGQLIQVGLVAATWPAPLALEPSFKIIDFLGKRASQLPLRPFSSDGFFPAVLHPTFLQSLDEKSRALIQSSLGEFRKYHFTKVLAPYHEIQNLWVELKSRA